MRLEAAYVVTMLDGIAYGMLLFVLAAGLALMVGVMDTLNLAHGTLYLIGAYIAHLLANGSLLGLALAVAVGVVVGAASGAGLAALLQPLRGGNHLDQALVTIGVAYIAADLLSSTFGATPLAADPPQALAGRIDVAGYGYPIYRLTYIGVAVLVAVALHVIVQRTTAGVLLRAAISDPAMAAATGLNVRRIRVVAFAAGATLTVAAGVLGAPLLGPAPGVDTTVLVLCLIVVILGGAGSVRGTLAAALLVGQVQTLGVVLAPELGAFALFVVVLAVLAVRGRAATAGGVRAA